MEDRPSSSSTASAVPRKTPTLEDVPPCSSGAPLEDTNSSDSMSHLQGFVEEQGSPADSPTMTQGFQGIVQRLKAEQPDHEQEVQVIRDPEQEALSYQAFVRRIMARQGSQRDRGTASRMESEDKEGFKVPPPVESHKRVLSSSDSEDDSGPSRPARAKRVRFSNSQGEVPNLKRVPSAKKLSFGVSPGGSGKRRLTDSSDSDDSWPSTSGVKRLCSSPVTDDARLSPSQPEEEAMTFSSPQGSGGIPGALHGLVKEEEDLSGSFNLPSLGTPPPSSSRAQHSDDDDNENTPVGRYKRSKRPPSRAKSLVERLGVEKNQPAQKSPRSLRHWHSASEASIKEAVHKMSEDPNLIADSSKLCLLPTIPGKRQGLKSISHDTLADLINGKYSEEVENFHIVDCRYPYEYDGGHIKNAVNIYTRSTLIEKYIKKVVKVQDKNKRFFLIFHCEFSSERGPDLYSFLRSTDRTQNAEHYPFLYYPEMYLLEKGYSNFFQYHQDLCEPQSYTHMHDENYKTELLKYEDERKKADGKKRTESMTKSGSGRRSGTFRSLNL